jgi:hypothetical protein
MATASYHNICPLNLLHRDRGQSNRVAFCSIQIEKIKFPANRFDKQASNQGD